MASQKLGKDQPKMAKTLVAWSIIVSRCTAESTPKYIPKKIINGIDGNTISAVRGNLSRIVCKTSLFDAVE
jgi:hypothetical protein